MRVGLTPPNDDLSLRDVHVPPSPSWWPPAPGWWVLASVVCVALLISWLIYRHRRAIDLRRQHVLVELELLAQRHREDDVAYATSLHQLLRRAVRRYASDAHQLQGDSWRDVLARVPVDAGTLNTLMTIDARMYRPHADFDRVRVQAAAHRWLATALRHQKAVAQDAKHA